MTEYILWLDQVGMDDLNRVGGKNASLGEMISQLSGLGVSVPGGFATTADAYRDFLSQSQLDQRIRKRLENLAVDDVNTLLAAGKEIRQWIMDTPFPAQLDRAVEQAWQQLAEKNGSEPEVAVRSSATAEDLPDASFAGQQETFLNVRGIDDVKQKMHAVFASLYNDRAISYRVHQGFEHHDVALSASVQIMVRSDIGASGVMFTLDTESGFREVVFLTASWGLGETVVQGSVNPDEFYLYKPNTRAGRPSILRRNLGSKAERMVYADGIGTLTEPVPDELRQRFCISDEDAEELARQALIIEDHYGKPMDIEWGKDGATGKIYILQARPETV
nr:phosphoenolpyruvate synthase [Halothiobacillus sp.]